MDRNSPWQFYADSTDTWLDGRALAAISKRLPALAEEVVQAIQREVPDYARPLSGEFGEGIRSGTEVALRRFIGDETTQSPALYRTLGYGEHRAGRSLDALQSAYRVGARVAWRGMSRVAADAGASEEVQRNLAEAMFAYIDQISAESIEGYAEGQLEQAGEVERERARLLDGLLSAPPLDATTLADMAERARWPLPRSVACLVLSGRQAGQAARRLSGDSLSAQLGEITCVIVPNPAGLEHEARALAERLHVGIGFGPSVAATDAASSLRWARLAHDLLGGAEGVVVAEERLADVALLVAADVLAALRDSALAPLDGESERSRARLEATLLAWLRHHGSQRAMAAELAVHPQTVRYRLGRLRELFGPALEDPDRRFELELALREALAGARPPER